MIRRSLVAAAFTIAAATAALDAGPARAHEGAHKGGTGQAPSSQPATQPATPPAPKDARLPFHDHTALHGGVVRMTGDDHLELTVEPDGALRVWVSDAWRRPITRDLEATVTVTTPDGVEVVKLSPKDGTLVGKSAARADVKRSLKLEGSARGVPVLGHWDFAPETTVEVGKPLTLHVTEAGFTPSLLVAKPGQQVRLIVVRKTNATCAKDIVVPGLVAKQDLPLDQPVEIAFTLPKRKGDVKFGCSMDMIGGTIRVR